MVGGVNPTEGYAKTMSITEHEHVMGVAKDHMGGAKDCMGVAKGVAKDCMGGVVDLTYL
jgi:hypothetical protein